MKAISRKIILISFIIVICLSWPIWLLFSNFVGTENYEKRAMKEMPLLRADTYESFSTEFSDYFGENIPFRNELISLNSLIDYFIFDVSSNEDVIVGKDDWLFYNKTDDGNPVGCYCGNDMLSDTELQVIAAKWEYMNEILSGQGKEFVLFILPNKERVYPEYMPSRYGIPAKEYQALQVVNYLRDNTEIRVVYPYEELIEAKESIDKNIWYKSDTHWNKIGGYVGACALLKELGIYLPPVDGKEISINDNGPRAGDLADLLNLRKVLQKNDREYTVEGYNTHDMEIVYENYSTDYHYKAVNADPRKIYIVRDSFGGNMSNYIGSQFSETNMRNIMKYNYDNLSDFDPDVIVFETVERYLYERLVGFVFDYDM